jgi:hypothetical protein
VTQATKERNHHQEEVIQQKLETPQNSQSSQCLLGIIVFQNGPSKVDTCIHTLQGILKQTGGQVGRWDAQLFATPSIALIDPAPIAMKV